MELCQKTYQIYILAAISLCLKKMFRRNTLLQFEIARIRVIYFRAARGILIIFWST